MKTFLLNLLELEEAS